MCARARKVIVVFNGIVRAPRAHLECTEITVYLEPKLPYHVHVFTHRINPWSSSIRTAIDEKGVRKETTMDPVR